MKELLILRDIRKRYGESVILHGVDLQIAPGEIFFLLGPSGCGKSTLLRIIAGLIEPDSGSIELAGRDITHVTAEKRRTAMVFQNYALWPHLDVEENVGFAPRLAGMRGNALLELTQKALHSVHLDGYGKRRVPSLSGGQQQRVALARALAASPQILLLDEPLSNLDAKLREEMRTEIRTVLQSRDLAAVYVTHDRAEAMSVADRIAVMENGKIVETGTPQQIYLHPKTRFAAEFLGAANFLEGTASGPRAVHTEIGDFQLDEPLLPREEVTLLMRPELLLPGMAMNRISGTLTDSTFLGDFSECRFSAGGREIIFRQPLCAGLPPPRGASCTVGIKPEHIAVLRG